jgi:uncharacterized protein YbjT (DUF2867 family)
MTIAITAPTGHIGSRLAGHLLDAGASVTLLARDPAKVAPLVARGARVAAGSLADPAFVTAATAGAKALFWLTPPDITAADNRAYQRRLGEVAATAIATNRIPHVVNLSSIGGQLGHGVGPVNGLFDVEQAIDAVATHVTHLRPAAFMENLLGSLGSIRDAGALFLPVGGSVRVPMIATRDIAEAAAARLRDLSWTGRHRILLRGPGSPSFDEIAALIARLAGRAVRHVEVTAEQAHAALVGMGISADVAASFIELYQSFGSGLITTPDAGQQEIGTPTSIEQFVRDTLVPALAV